MKLQRLAIVLICLALCGFSPVPTGSSSGGGGSGTVTSLTCGTGITCSPSTITTTGSVTPTPLTGWTAPAGVITNQAVTANTYIVTAYVIPFSLTFSKITFRLGTADGAHNNDVCVWNSSGTLIANIGAQTISSNGSHTIADTQGSQTIAAGIYFVGATSAASTLAFSGSGGNTGNAAITLFASGSYGTSSGGACANITAPTIAPSWNADVSSSALAMAMALS